MKKIQEIVRLRLDRKASVRQIAAACCIGRTTVSDYLTRIEVSGLKWPEAGELSEEQLSAALFPPEKVQQSRPVPDWAQVRRELSRKGVTLMLLWQEYQLANPGAYSYSRFARLYRRWVGTMELRMVQPHKAGEKLFVDWAGPTLAIVDAVSCTSARKADTEWRPKRTLNGAQSGHRMASKADTEWRAKRTPNGVQSGH